MNPLGSSEVACDPAHSAWDVETAVLPRHPRHGFGQDALQQRLHLRRVGERVHVLVVRVGVLQVAFDRALGIRSQHHGLRGGVAVFGWQDDQSMPVASGTACWPTGHAAMIDPVPAPTPNITVSAIASGAVVVGDLCRDRRRRCNWLSQPRTIEKDSGTEDAGPRRLPPGAGVSVGGVRRVGRILSRGLVQVVAGLHRAVETGRGQLVEGTVRAQARWLPGRRGSRYRTYRCSHRCRGWRCRRLC